jgi:coat protein Gp5
MPNTLTAIGMTQLANAMVAGLYDQATLINTIYRDAESELVVGKGDSVTIRAPQIIAATNFTGTATATNVVEGKITIVIDQQPYSQVVLSAKERTLAVEDLARQVVAPQVGGIVEFLEELVSAELEATTGAVSGATWREAVAGAYAALTGEGVPMAGRTLAVAPDVAGSLLTDTVFVSAADRGDGGAALNEATLGRLNGFNVVVSPFITAATAVAYHETAVAAIFRNPVPPSGGVLAGSAAFAGYSAQVLYGFSNTALSDVITVQTLGGIGSAPDVAKRAVKVTVAAAP